MDLESFLVVGGGGGGGGCLGGGGFPVGHCCCKSFLGPKVLSVKGYKADGNRRMDSWTAWANIFE